MSIDNIIGVGDAGDTPLSADYDKERYFRMSFFKNYGVLLRKSGIDKSKEPEEWKRFINEYLNRLGKINRVLKEYNMHKNILFISDKPIGKDVFLTAASNLKNLHSVRLSNTAEIFDIYWGLRKPQNPNIDDDEIVFSEGDINERLLCIEINTERELKGAADMVNQTVMRRIGKREDNLNWLFFYGSKSKLESAYYSEFLNIFKDPNLSNYTSIIDLSGKVELSVSRTGKSSKNMLDY